MYLSDLAVKNTVFVTLKCFGFVYRLVEVSKDCALV